MAATSGGVKAEKRAAKGRRRSDNVKQRKEFEECGSLLPRTDYLENVFGKQ